MFGEMVTVYLVDKWHQLGQPNNITLLEMGPGRATLMSDILKNTRSKFPSFYDAIASVSLVEVSPALRETQRATLSQHVAPAKLQHFETLFDIEPRTASSTAGECNDLFIVSHEFFDCLSTNVYERRGAAWMEKFLAYDAQRDEFEFVLHKLNEHTERYFLYPLLQRYEASQQHAGLSEAPVRRVGAVTQLGGDSSSRNDDSGHAGAGDALPDYCEVSFDALQLFEHTVRLLEARGGVQLLMDYGNVNVTYPSLRFIVDHEIATHVDSAYLKQHLGNVDVSVDVHFAPLIDIAQKHGLHTLFDTQGSFLRRCGLEHLVARRLKNYTDESAAERMIDDFQRIHDDDQMGRVYKVLETTLDKRETA